MNDKLSVISVAIIALFILYFIASGSYSSGGHEGNNTNTSINAGKNPIVVFETTKGTFSAEIYEKEAPVTAGNFLSLVRSGFYNNLTFHRYVSGFVIQGGDPNGDGTGGSGNTIPLEINKNLTHGIGSLGMARASDPDSATSQFFIVIGEAGFLDGEYAIFGKVTQGMEVVYQLRKGDRMVRVYIG